MQFLKKTQLMGGGISLLLLGCLPLSQGPSAGAPEGTGVNAPARGDGQSASYGEVHAASGPAEVHEAPRGAVTTSTGGPYYGLTPGRPGIALMKGSFFPGEKIHVYVTAPQGFEDDAWVGIVPSNVPHGSEAVNDKHDLVYGYLKGRQMADFTFTAPYRPGHYDMRLNDTDGGGREVAYLAFTVFDNSTVANPNPAPPPDYSRPTITTDKKYYQPAEPIRVSYTAYEDYWDQAWLGIVPSDIDHGSEAMNDKFDLQYHYLKKRTRGEMEFVAPDKPGHYDLRMNDRDDGGREVAYVSVVVFDTSDREGATPAPPQEYKRPQMATNKKVYAPGETISLTFTAYPFYSDNAWIGIVPEGIPHGSEERNDRYDMAYEYLKGRVRGTLMFKAPSRPGNYEFRMNDRDNGGREVAWVGFTVEAPK